MDKGSENQLNGIFQQIVGRNANFLKKVRFGGPVGKLALIAVFLMIPLSIVAYKASSVEVQITCIILATFAILLIASGIVWYSHLHPEQATLEGMEVVVLEQHKAWAAKGMVVTDQKSLGIPGSLGGVIAEGPKNEQ